MIHDVHTHRLPPNPEEAIVCCRYSDFPLAIQQEATYLSVGIHPWYLTQEDIQLQLEWLNNRLQDQRIIAIGESGLDKCCRTPLDLQLEAFEKQTARSESLHLPMILHVVRAYQEIIACSLIFIKFHQNHFSFDSSSLRSPARRMMPSRIRSWDMKEKFRRIVFRPPPSVRKNEPAT